MLYQLFFFTLSFSLVAMEGYQLVSEYQVMQQDDETRIQLFDDAPKSPSFFKNIIDAHDIGQLEKALDKLPQSELTTYITDQYDGQPIDTYANKILEEVIENYHADNRSKELAINGSLIVGTGVLITGLASAMLHTVHAISDSGGWQWALMGSSLVMISLAGKTHYRNKLLKKISNPQDITNILTGVRKGFLIGQEQNNPDDMKVLEVANLV